MGIDETHPPDHTYTVTMSQFIDPWASFAHDPRDPELASLRAGDADRELVRGVLASAYAEGRLSRTEFDQRSDQVGAARLMGDLPPLMRDLVPPRPTAVAPLVSASDEEIRLAALDVYAATRRQGVLTFLGPSIICWAIWGAIALGSGAQFPWPLIVMAATLVGLLRTVVQKQALIADEVQRLEKKRDKQLRGRSKGRNRQRIVEQIRDQIDPRRHGGDGAGS